MNFHKILNALLECKNVHTIKLLSHLESLLGELAKESSLGLIGGAGESVTLIVSGTPGLASLLTPLVAQPSGHLQLPIHALLYFPAKTTTLKLGPQRKLGASSQTDFRHE